MYKSTENKKQKMKKNKMRIFQGSDVVGFGLGSGRVRVRFGSGSGTKKVLGTKGTKS